MCQSESSNSNYQQSSTIDYKQQSQYKGQVIKAFQDMFYSK